MTGLLNPKSSEIGHFFLHDSRCVPKAMGFLSREQFFFFLQNQFSGEVLSSECEWSASEKKVMHLYYHRSMRHEQPHGLGIRTIKV